MTMEEEFEFNERQRKRLKENDREPLKERMFGGGQEYQERKYLQELKNKENREIDGIASRKVTQVPRTFGQLVESQAMKVHDAYRLTKHEGAAYVGAGISRILNYPQKKLHDWTEDYRLNREYNQGKKDARHLTNPDLLQETDVKKIPSKLNLEKGKSLAYVRGATEGVYHENMKLHNVHQRESDRRDREIKKYTREEKKKDVSVDAKKAYAVERAKTAGRLAASQQAAPNMDFMNFLLGGQENPHSGKPRRRVYNVFKGVWE